jgi:transcriptional regulator with XRE-family HTH domain
MLTFGEFVRGLRLKAGLTLRRFCQLIGFDPSNWSKTERGLLPPPKSATVLQEIAQVLNLNEESEDYKTLFDLAAIGQIPPHLVSSPRVMEKLPVLFRTIRGEKPARKELEDLIKILSEE